MDPSSSFFKDGGEMLTLELITILSSIWDSKDIRKDWCEPMFAPIYSYENHKGISLVSIASKLRMRNKLVLNPVQVLTIKS